MNDIDNLKSQLPGINVVPMSVVGNMGNIERANVWNLWQSLEEVVLLTISETQTRRIVVFLYPISVIYGNGHFP